MKTNKLIAALTAGRAKVAGMRFYFQMRPESYQSGCDAVDVEVEAEGLAGGSQGMLVRVRPVAGRGKMLVSPGALRDIPTPAQEAAIKARQAKAQERRDLVRELKVSRLVTQRKAALQRRIDKLEGKVRATLIAELEARRIAHTDGKLGRVDGDNIERLVDILADLLYPPVTGEDED